MRFKGHNIAKVHGLKLTPNLEDLELKFKETPTPGLELTPFISIQSSIFLSSMVIQALAKCPLDPRV